MDRLQLLLLGFPILLFFSDVVNLFSTSPPRPPPPSLKSSSRFHHHSNHQIPDFPTSSQIGGLGYGTRVDLKLCVSCSYRSRMCEKDSRMRKDLKWKGTAMTLKKMLESSFPGIDVVLSNYPPAFPKRLLSKVVPVVQIGVIAVIAAGDQIFPRLGMAPPPWYYTLRANRFGSMASTWLLGNFLQSSLQSSGAFEVYCDGELVFSKLQEQRFPSEYELRELIAKRLPDSSFSPDLGRVAM